MTERQNIIALTKLHISQNYEKNDWILTDPETFAFYKSFASKSKMPTPHKSVQPERPVPAAKPVSQAKPALPHIPKKALMETSKNLKPVNIEREKPKPATEVEFSNFKKIIEKYFPSQKILDSQPDDTKAQAYAQRWQKAGIPPEIVIIDTAQSPSEKVFLENVALALESRFYPTCIISINQLDKNLKLRLVVGTSHVLKGVSLPSVVMEPVSSYLQQPPMKAQLWQDLKNTLQSS